MWQTVALGTFHALVFMGVTGGGEWRSNPTNQPPACSVGNERVPRTEGNLAFRRKGKRGESGEEITPMNLQRRNPQGWRSELTLDAEWQLVNVPGLYLSFSRCHRERC